MKSNSSSERPIVLAMSGASGAIYAVRLLNQLVLANIPVHLVVSPSAQEVLRQELFPKEHLDAPNLVNSLLSYRWREPYGNSSGTEHPRWPSLDSNELVRSKSLVELHDSKNFLSPIASGSHQTRGMVVLPCSGSTLSGIVHATSQNLIIRAADVHLKEQRKLILVNRETPLSVFQLENMHRAAQAGAVMLPAMPGWYHGVNSILDLVDFVVSRVLDHLQIPHQLIKRWAEGSNPNGEETGS